MSSLPRWFDKARATGARLISSEPSSSSSPQRRSRSESEYADIPPFLLPLSVRVKLDKQQSKARSRAAPYDVTTKRKRKPSLKMPTVLKRLTGPPSCPIVIAQYKDEFRGVGHEEELHWALVVITDPQTLSGPSFEAYAQQKRRRTRPSATTASRAVLAPSSAANAAATTPRASSEADAPSPSKSRPRKMTRDGASEPQYETHWYTRQALTSLFDVCATVRSLCLGGVQVGAVRPTDVHKLVEYLQGHPPVPAHAGWSSRDYVLELLELLRPFKMLRADLQSLHLRARDGERREVSVEDILPDLREVGMATQESIFREDFRPCVKYAS